MNEMIRSARVIQPDSPPIVKSLIDRARHAAGRAAERAAEKDQDGAFPIEDIASLARDGLLMAPFPAALGGDDLGIGDPDRLRNVLTTFGRGSLSLGRLCEGHAVTTISAA